MRHQTSSGQAHAQIRPHVSREMLPIHCHALPSIVIHIHCPKTVDEKNILSARSLTFILNEKH